MPGGRVSMRGMGRHTATDDRSDHAGGEVGWPAEPNDGTGLGWPGDLQADDEPAHSAA
jgi:hypothetical protein